MSGTDYTLTTNYNLYKPIPNADVAQWGSHWNLNADTIDSTLHSLQTAGPFLPLAGGTVMGPTTHSAALTASATGTGLAVTNNATIGGTLGITGAATFGTTFGAASGTNITLNLGGAGHTLTLAGIGGTGNIGTITANLGAHVVDFTTTGTLFKAFYTALGPSTNPWSGAYSASKSPLHIAFSPSGTVTPAGGGFQYMQWSTPSDTTAVGTGNTISMISIAHQAGGASMTGNRSALSIACTQTASTGNAGGGSAFQGGQASGNCSYNEGGTGLTGATAVGANYAWIEYARLFSGATNFYVNKAKEIDLQIAAGASAVKNIGMDVTLLSTHAVQGAEVDYAYGVQRQLSSAVGFKAGIQFGTFDGVDPFGANATIISWAASGNPAGVPPVATNGIDFRVGAISANAFASANFVVKGGTGSTVIGNAAISQTASGLSVDIPYKVGSYSSVAAGGTGNTTGDYYVDNADVPGLWTVTTSAGVVTSASILPGRNPYSASGPSTLTLTNLNADRPSTCSINVSWVVQNALSLNPTGKQILTNLPAAATDAAAATAGVPINGLYNNAGVVHVRLT